MSPNNYLSFSKSYKLSVHEFRIRIISHVKVQETVKSQMSATTRLLTWFGRFSNTAYPYSKSISIIKMYPTVTRKYRILFDKQMSILMFAWRVSDNQV